MGFKLEKREPKKCGCGKTQNPQGFCDGTHLNKESKETNETN